MAFKSGGLLSKGLGLVGIDIFKERVDFVHFYKNPIVLAFKNTKLYNF